MNTTQNDNPWRKISTRDVYQNPWIGVREDAVIHPDGSEGIYGVVHFKNLAVGILAVEDDYLYLVGQYRYTLETYSWEIPEGGCPEDEDPLEAAKRELVEETGISAGRWELMGTAHLSNSVTDETAFWYQATELSHGAQSPEGTEQLQVRRVKIADALQMSLSGEITDALSQLAIFHYHARNYS